MHSYKRKLTEAKKELDLMRRKSREMDGIVSLIRRSWSQVSLYIYPFFFIYKFYIVYIIMISYKKL